MNKFMILMQNKNQLNVLGEILEECSNDPLTGGFEMAVVILMKMIMAFIPYVQKLQPNFWYG